MGIFNLFIVDLSFELFNNCCISNETNEETSGRNATVLQRAVVQKKEIRIEMPSQKVVIVDKKLFETKNKQIAAARRIQQFWRDGRNRLRNMEKYG